MTMQQKSPDNVFTITEDWPKKGVRFFHMGPWLQNQAVNKTDLLAIARRFSHLGVTHIVYLGARGFLLTQLTDLLKAKTVIIRKKGEMPDPVIEETYSGEYRKETTIVLSKGDIQPGARVLIVDDVLATGGTAVASIKLVQKAGATVVGMAFLLELEHLQGRFAIESINDDIVVSSSYIARQDGSFYRTKADTCAIPGCRTVLDVASTLQQQQDDERAVIMWHDNAVETALSLVRQYPQMFVPSPIRTNRFPDGHYDIEFNADLVGKHLVYVMSLLNPEETLHQLELLIALGRQHVKSFTVILNYFAPGTKERVDQPGELARAQTTAQLISESLNALPTAGPTTVIIYDIHAVQEQFYFNDSCSLALLSSTKLMGKIVQDQRMVLVFPDQGAYKRFGKEPMLKNAPTLICNKERGPNDSRVIVIADRKNCDGLSDEDLANKHVLIFDDILHSGGTSWETYLMLKRLGFKQVSLYATHAVLSNHAWMRFLKSGDRAGFHRIYCTNSVPSVTERFLRFYPETFTILDLTPITAEFIFKKYEYKPLSDDDDGASSARGPVNVNVWFGTQSGPKVKAIQSVFPGAQFLAETDTSSGVNSQPFGLDEIELGAGNRMVKLEESWRRMNKHERSARELNCARRTILISMETGLIFDEAKKAYRDHSVVLVNVYDDCRNLLSSTSSESVLRGSLKWTDIGVDCRFGPIVPDAIVETVKEHKFQLTAGKILCAKYPDRYLDDADWYNAANHPISRFEYLHAYLRLVANTLQY